MRAYNCTTNEQDLWVKFQSDSGDFVNVSWKNDPNNPSRGQVRFDDSETAKGGGWLSASKKGFSIFEVRCNVPNDSPNGIELGLESDPPNAIIDITSGVDPFSIPTADLLHFRGSIWTARAPIAYGPRPGQPDNILAMDYFADTNVFGEADSAKMLDGYCRQRKYRQFPSGPDIAAGYHGQYPDVDIRNDVDGWVRRMQQAYNAGGIPVHFLCPDGWSLDDCKRELEPIYRRPEVNRMIRLTIPRGWEPNGADGGYNISNEEWVAFIRWSKEVFPTAIPGIHMIADFDAPIGHDVPPPGVDAKSWAWKNCYDAGARFFADQIGGYLNTGPDFDPYFMSELVKRIQYFKSHFAAWGMVDMKYFLAEFAAYKNYWNNWPEEKACELGDFAIANGADGSLDGCTVE